MANSRSNLMANLLAGTRNDVRLGHSRYRSRVITVTLDNTEAAGHLVPLYRFSLKDIIHQIWVSHPNIAGATDVNVGPWTSVDWTLGDGTALDADILVDGYSMAVATTVGKWADMTVAGAAGGHTSTTIGRQLWEDAGYATEAAAYLAQPLGTVDLVMQFVADPGAAATIKVKIDYSAGD